MEKNRQDFDEVVWDKNDEDWDKSLKQLRLTATCDSVQSVVEEKFKQSASLETPLVVGGYNMLYRFRFDNTSLPDVMVRVACPHRAQFPDEKTLREAAIANYITNHTQVPIPKQFYRGTSPDFGSYTILEHVKSSRDLSDALTTPYVDRNEIHVLDPDIPEYNLKKLYHKVAYYMLRLAIPSFPCIGSLVENGSSYSVAARPITQNMNNMVQLANNPRTVFPRQEQTYATADEWYLELADMHVAQLVFQHNDLVTTEDDCRNKYVARQLFRSLAKQGRLSTFGFAEDGWSAQSKAQTLSPSPAPSGSGSIRIWCDDLRPANILLNEVDDIVAFIDWEFAYAGPSQFILDPPWWLLLDVPEMWSSGIDDWRQVYDRRLKTWISAMEQAEEMIELKSLPFKLSTYMRESWETGRFWLNYAARKSWAFDTIFWKFLDERFFGNRTSDVPEHDLWKTRVHLLGESERSAMDKFVEVKMKESEERVIVNWGPEDVRNRLSQVIFD